MITFSLAVMSDRLQALTRRLDSDLTNPGRLRLFSDPRPSGGGLTGDAFELAVLVFPKPSLFEVVGNTMTIQNPVPTLIRATGDATWARFETGGGDYVADCDVGVVKLDGTVMIPGEVLLVRDPFPEVEGSTPPPINRLFAGGELSVLMVKMKDV